MVSGETEEQAIWRFKMMQAESDLSACHAKDRKREANRPHAVNACSFMTGLC